MFFFINILIKSKMFRSCKTLHKYIYIYIYMFYIFQICIAFYLRFENFFFHCPLNLWIKELLSSCKILSFEMGTFIENTIYRGHAWSGKLEFQILENQRWLIKPSQHLEVGDSCWKNSKFSQLSWLNLNVHVESMF